MQGGRARTVALQLCSLRISTVVRVEKAAAGATKICFNQHMLDTEVLARLWTMAIFHGVPKVITSNPVQELKSKVHSVSC